MDQGPIKALLAVAAAAICLGLSPSAEAQVLGTQGDAVFGAERLFGVRGERVYEDLPNPANDYEANHTVISFGLADTAVPYNIPRLTFDYLAANKFSVGGALGFSTADTRIDGVGSVTSNRFVLAPRAGFLHMFGRVGGIWPRGGLTYHRTTVEDVYVESGLGLNLECQFPFVFTPGFGMLVGLAFDQSLTANRDPENGVDYPVSYRSIGLQIGLFGWI
jgi:hypothetical protein